MNLRSISTRWKSRQGQRIRAGIVLFFFGLFAVWDGFRGEKWLFIPAYCFGFFLWLILLLPLFGVRIWKNGAAEKGDELWDGTGSELYSSELQQAIEAVTASNTSETRKGLYQVLMTLTYCLPTPGPAEGNKQPLTLTKNEQGEVVLPAFSDPNALKRWDKNPHSMLVMPADKLFELAIANDFAEILINPAGPAGGKLTRAEYISLSRGILPY